MKSNILQWVWLAGGALLMLLELVMPGLIIVFFGAGAVIVGILCLSGLVQDVVTSIILWVLISLFLVLVFRRLAIKLFPSESSYQLVEEDVDAIGKVVEVVSTVDPKSPDGRIFFNGTSWPAISSSGSIEAGRKARILYRDNISWVIEACDDDEAEGE